MNIERIKKIISFELRAFTTAALSLLVIATILALAGIDRFPNFHGWLAIASVIGVGLALPLGFRFRTVAAAVLVANVSVLLPFAPVKPAMGQTCQADLTAVSINAWGNSSDHDMLVARIEKDRPAILFVSELSDKLETRLAPLYTYRVLNPAGGSALFTNYAIGRPDQIRVPSGRDPLDVVLSTPRGNLRVIGAHPPAPGNDEARHARNQDLLKIASAVKAIDQPTLLLGDLNITMFSPHYAPLTDVGLTNTRAGRGVAATWPEYLPLRIPIDHIMHSKELQTCDLSVGESFGSDHLPLQAALAWNAPSPAKRLAAR